MESFARKARDVMECLHAYGIHSVTLQPELYDRSVDRAVATAVSTDGVGDSELSRRTVGGEKCQISCASTRTSCTTLKCCT